MGNPSKYKSEYCKTAVEYLGRGHSIEALAGKLDVAESTVHDWGHAHPEFRSALNLGIAKAIGFWEDKLIAGADGETRANATLIIFALKNRASAAWSDKIVNEHTGKNGDPIKHSVEITFVEAGEE